jgi:hypothetical protein
LPSDSDFTPSPPQLIAFFLSFFLSSRNDSPLFQMYYTFQDPRVEEYIQELKLAGQTGRSTSPRSEKKKQKKDRQRETENSVSVSLSVAESLRSSKKIHN